MCLGFSRLSINSVALATTAAFRSPGTFSASDFLGAYIHIFLGFLAIVLLQAGIDFLRCGGSAPESILSGLTDDR
jgi:hypothetical protein